MISAVAIERALFAVLAAFLLSVPWTVPALVNSFWVSVIAEILIWSLFAASVNLLFGYVGLLSFLEGVISSVADPTVARISSLVLMSAVLLLRPQGLFKGATR